jgi:hypothetical protein
VTRWRGLTLGSWYELPSCGSANWSALEHVRCVRRVPSGRAASSPRTRISLMLALLSAPDVANRRQAEPLGQRPLARGLYGNLLDALHDPSALECRHSRHHNEAIGIGQLCGDPATASQQASAKGKKDASTRGRGREGGIPGVDIQSSEVHPCSVPLDV